MKFSYGAGGNYRDVTDIVKAKSFNTLFSDHLPGQRKNLKVNFIKDGMMTEVLVDENFLVTSMQTKVSPKLVDVTMVHSEMDMLELRFTEHDPAVDKFVVVESAFTFTGNEKPLYFKQNIDRFKKWQDKILHLVITEFPASCVTPWDREHYQRNYAMSHLELGPDDLVLCSDADEIIRPSVLEDMKLNLDKVISLHTDFYYYNCNWKLTQTWLAPYIVRYGYLKQFSLQELREKSLHGGLGVNPLSGWHLSYFMTAEDIAIKLRSFSHTEYAHLDSIAHIEKSVHEGVDLFDRPDTVLTLAEQNDDLPANIHILGARYQRM